MSHLLLKLAAALVQSHYTQRQASASWDQGADDLGRNARVLSEQTSASGTMMCRVGGPMSDASTGRANTL
jgi:hypothetical protein